jgi:hypothetical protein
LFENIRPPMRPDASYTVLLIPSSASSSAQFSPAMPPPAITTVGACAASENRGTAIAAAAAPAVVRNVLRETPRRLASSDWMARASRIASTVTPYAFAVCASRNNERRAPSSGVLVAIDTFATTSADGAIVAELFCDASR